MGVGLWYTIPPRNLPAMRKLSLYMLSLLLAIAVSWISVRAQTPTAGSIVKLDPGLDQIVSPNTKLELLQGEGSFEGGEGPLWMQRGEFGYLLFSDVSGNRVMQ